MKYKISVIVPVYNTEKYIYECLESILKQQLKELEIIIVDDASQDNAIAVIEPLIASHEARINLVRLQKNVGLSEARNIGMSYAQGEYIGFIDSDDYVDPSFYQQLYQLAKQASAPLYGCGYTLFDGHSRNEMIPQSIAENTSVCSKIFKRDFVQKLALRFPRNELFEDEIFTYLATLSAGSCPILPSGLYFYRINPNGICRAPGAAKKRLYARMSSSADFMNRIDKAGFLPQQNKLCLQMICRHAMLQLRSRVSFSDLLVYWNFSAHLIEKYKLRPEQQLQDYFISRFVAARKSFLRLAFLYLRAGKSDEV